jgi:hypothetical protein
MSSKGTFRVRQGTIRECQGTLGNIQGMPRNIQVTFHHPESSTDGVDAIAQLETTMKTQPLF